ncbi:hypothetical protein PVAP13_2NG260300 [Panicum virgatum]|uniref:Uncharacterized protein n=1 Tax=Panicum virgatum TaxID=38727 RepID=A0A8T0VFU6_PANVG|nr:hypothetical protein PVAP13_2NG260300 [Panicum virgatum]KAG2633277.1 hypothetical protein PVAP13_2NG260300 [Panicum virgatum]KAG2633279.1 hypothetical protein PVAP13_2NG260300 [Panicum virgatum]KAG2633280.1 hypothetical protein PVAP13_2NG260300 [Panicum virgatum]
MPGRASWLRLAAASNRFRSTRAAARGPLSRRTLFRPPHPVFSPHAPPLFFPGTQRPGSTRPHRAAGCLTSSLPPVVPPPRRTVDAAVRPPHLLALHARPLPHLPKLPLPPKPRPPPLRLSRSTRLHAAAAAAVLPLRPAVRNHLPSAPLQRSRRLLSSLCPDWWRQDRWWHWWRQDRWWRL